MIEKVKEKLQAQEMRRNGESIKVIAKNIGVSPASVSSWVKNIRLSSDQRIKLDARKNTSEFCKRARAKRSEKCRKIRSDFQKIGRYEAKKGNPLHIQGCMLFWAEGGKNRNMVKLGNTDPYLVMIFVKFLRECLDVPSDVIGLRIRCHANEKITSLDVQNFWLETLKLSTDNIKQISVDSDKRVKTGKKKNIHIYGFCEVCVCSTEIVQRIFGSIQEYIGVDKNEWLDC